MRASNTIYDVPEGRPIWKTAPIRLGVTIVTMILLVGAAVIVVVTGGLAHKAGNLLGVGPVAVSIWDIAKRPVLLIIIGLILAILFWVSPNAKHGFQWVSPGGFIAVILWLAASGLFALYVANFSHYNKIYGSLAGVIIFLIWMWISNVAILLGAEFNAELERGRAVAGGHPLHEEPFSELRDDRKLRNKPKGNRSARRHGRQQATRRQIGKTCFAGVSGACRGSAVLGAGTSVLLPSGQVLAVPSPRRPAGARRWTAGDYGRMVPAMDGPACNYGGHGWGR